MVWCVYSIYTKWIKQSSIAGKQNNIKFKLKFNTISNEVLITSYNSKLCFLN